MQANTRKCTVNGFIDFSNLIRHADSLLKRFLAFNDIYIIIFIYSRYRAIQSLSFNYGMKENET